MDKMDKLLLTVLVIVGILSYIIGATHPIKKQSKIKTIIKTDTIIEYKTDSSLFELSDSLYCVIENLNNEIENINEELLISNFKLERIKEYNKIAAKDNNIIFLRGWINRTLTD